MRNTMADRPFVHLHCHSHYSLLDGANRIPELVDRTQGTGHERPGPDRSRQPLRRHRVLPRVQGRRHQSRSSATRPTSPPASATDREARRRGEAGFHLTLLAQNAHRLQEPRSRWPRVAFLEGYHYVPRIDKELLEAHQRRASSA